MDPDVPHEIDVPEPWPGRVRLALVRSAAVQPRPRGVRVNAVAPGRGAETSDIAAAPYFPASPLSSYVTGRTLVVAGGVGVRFPYPTIGGEQ
ncbi:hypothetical protein ACFXB3_10660 [Streptomyces sp. NPDC059447]|uniref:hypothetical protein n=1 Tax=Streptomyces sp. NPDC059447 TaxID=3346834 RepID=UPI00369C34D8